MKEKINELFSIWREDYLFSTVFISAVSALINVAYTVYNGVLGVLYQSPWNCSICVYYLLLSGIRAAVVYSQRSVLKPQETESIQRQRKVYLWTHIVLLALNLSLIVPIASMIRGQRQYTLGMIPAIAMAAYTTYRVTVSVRHFKRSRRMENPLIAELRTINMIDALVAILTLQNALIMANGGQNEKMRLVTAWTSGAIFLLILLFTVISFVSIRRYRCKGLQ
ncbi:MAG: hypothetical protein VZT48_12645 [Bulleidia sp.]|nr:hypothetical protein [Bulleidia sp.]